MTRILFYILRLVEASLSLCAYCVYFLLSLTGRPESSRQWSFQSVWRRCSLELHTVSLFKYRHYSCHVNTHVNIQSSRTLCCIMGNVFNVLESQQTPAPEASILSHSDVEMIHDWKRNKKCLWQQGRIQLVKASFADYMCNAKYKVEMRTPGLLLGAEV